MSRHADTTRRRSWRRDLGRIALTLSENVPLHSSANRLCSITRLTPALYATCSLLNAKSDVALANTRHQLSQALYWRMSNCENGPKMKELSRFCLVLFFFLHQHFSLMFDHTHFPFPWIFVVDGSESSAGIVQNLCPLVCYQESQREAAGQDRATAPPVGGGTNTSLLPCCPP